MFDAVLTCDLVVHIDHADFEKYLWYITMTPLAILMFSRHIDT